jgi:hypothetical protein
MSVLPEYLIMYVLLMQDIGMGTNLEHLGNLLPSKGDYQIPIEHMENIGNFTL